MEKPYYKHPRQLSAQSIKKQLDKKTIVAFADYQPGMLPESVEVQEVILQNIKACKYD